MGDFMGGFVGRSDERGRGIWGRDLGDVIGGVGGVGGCDWGRGLMQGLGGFGGGIRRREWGGGKGGEQWCVEL